jgi:hypothetical protein
MGLGTQQSTINKAPSTKHHQQSTIQNTQKSPLPRPPAPITCPSLDSTTTQQHFVLTPFPPPHSSVLKWFYTHRATAVLRTPTSSACPLAMDAAVEGGFRIGEFTLTTPDALHHMSNFVMDSNYEHVKFGMGTVMTVEDAKKVREGNRGFWWIWGDIGHS